MKKLYSVLIIGMLAIVMIVPTAAPALAATSAIVTSPFWYQFKIDGTLSETGTMAESSSPYWWVNSGAQLWLQNGLGKTVQGELPASSRWRLLYQANNPVDTDNGYHPQNIFRLLTRSAWQNVRQELYVKINKINKSASPNRQGHNGVLLFNRYVDSNNLYYVGVRVDGTAVIKKKIRGQYYTLAQTRVYPGTYDREQRPNLLPEQTWLGLRTDIKDNSNGSVNITLWLDRNQSGVWQPVLTAVDDGIRYGGAAIRAGGYGGLRTDFMDVEFDNYRAITL